MASMITSALSAVFTPPASCSTHWTYEASAFNNNTNGLLIQNAEPEHQDSDCFPPGFKQAGRAVHNSFVFSPGACPVGYSTAAVYNGPATTAICCPSSYNYYHTVSSVTAQASQSVELEGCLSMYGADAGVTTVPGVVFGGDLNTTTATGPLTMWAQPITIAYKQADLTLFTTTTSSPTSTAASTQQTGSASSATQTGSTSTQATGIAEASSSASGVVTTGNSNTGLTGGAIAGVAIACAIILGVLIAAAIFFRRRRAKNAPHTPLEPHSQGDHQAPAYYSGDVYAKLAQPPMQEHYHELSGGKSVWDHQVHETSAMEPAAQELYTDHPADPQKRRAELD